LIADEPLMNINDAIGAEWCASCRSAGDENDHVDIGCTDPDNDDDDHD
jgi:hypothetical protein